MGVPLRFRSISELMASSQPSITSPASDPPPFSYRAELKRKALHILALVVPLGMGWLGMPEALYVLVPLSAIGLAGDVLRAASPRFHRLIRRVFGPLMRPHEVPPPGTGVVINGATWVLVSATLLAAVFPLRVAVPVFTMFMVSDAVAALVERRWGRRYWPKSPRTVGGSAALLASGLAAIACFPSIPYGIGAASVAAACAAEALPGPGNDNLRVPVAGAAAVVLLERALLGEPISLFQGLLVL